jgi:hypothetical protein
MHWRARRASGAWERDEPRRHVASGTLAS